ncbi:Protein of unknown function DUF2800 [uncultured Caudovirales phage]|uniref:DUF2800 domain-containing protein n=1 Tax=uncultured Caudovirales phage TaxID=2100421 RepID=A0A6J7X8I8_9CAUD|nr:Protein of unknown function DUF2800 [uncultured Caudovirales phage]CAB4197775.1 Protein of unknown function DUF2800 [uncultured Caudovirales phage]CAB4211426.1 Protein of unknown function DUF2800 [uncultured Caudovirales phage]CAB5227090.1 Protein of unknown function DUF2800 [uncultured Caudovirales phage]
MSGTHAALSPSGAHRWMACPGSVVLEAEFPEESSSYADEGTLAHEVAAAMLLGTDVPLTADLEMIEEVTKYVDQVKAIVAATNGTLMVEVKVDASAFIPGSWGTSDVIIVAGDELITIDLKYGRGVRVDAEGNPQTRIYNVGAYAMLNDLVGPFTRFRSMIIQPRLDHVSEEVLTLEELMDFVAEARAAAIATDTAIRAAEDQLLGDAYLNPGAKQCRWCKAKASCPALRNVVATETACDFDDLTQADLPDVSREDLSRAMLKIELIEDWCKAVRAATERALLSGETVEGWKLVEGRRGARAWTDAAAVEAVMKKQFRLKDELVYDYTLISPTTAEKRFKDNPRRWSALQELIVQKQGGPSVAPESDKRPALRLAGGAEDYEALA